jgi:hypothetical protein
MRKITSITLALLLLAAGYVAYPLVTAWSIREAMQRGDSERLEHKIEWDSVRTSLRESLGKMASGSAGAGSGSEETAPELPAKGGLSKGGLWQRIKASVGRRAVDGIVDRYVTPEGLPQLFGVRNAYREVSGEAAELRALPWYRRAADFWSRLKRAEFKTPAAFEVEMADRNDAARHYIGLLELRGIEWKLTQLHVRQVDQQPPDDDAS